MGHRKKSQLNSLPCFREESKLKTCAAAIIEDDDRPFFFLEPSVFSCVPYTRHESAPLLSAVETQPSAASGLTSLCSPFMRSTSEARLVFEPFGRAGRPRGPGLARAGPAFFSARRHM